MIAAMHLTANAQLTDCIDQASCEHLSETTIAEGIELENPEYPVNAEAYSSTAPATNYEYWVGNIGPYKITMFLNGYTWEPGEIAGYYYYNSRPKTKFKLKVKKCEYINDKGTMRLILKEYTPKGNNTGTFNGTYDICRGKYYEGTFTNSKGQKYKFELM